MSDDLELNESLLKSYTMVSPLEEQRPKQKGRIFREVGDSNSGGCLLCVLFLMILFLFIVLFQSIGLYTDFWYIVQDEESIYEAIGATNIQFPVTAKTNMGHYRGIREAGGPEVDYKCTCGDIGAVDGYTTGIVASCTNENGDMALISFTSLGPQYRYYANPGDSLAIMQWMSESAGIVGQVDYRHKKGRSNTMVKKWF